MSTLHLDKLLDPGSIALIGASAREGSPALALARNIVDGGYRGRLHLVNPRYDEVLGLPCHRTLGTLPETPDVALVMVPERLLRRTLARCARAGIRVVLIMSGARESHRTLRDDARRLGLRILGPHCAGLIRPHLALNATVSASRVGSGSLAVVSQSASLGAALLDWAESSGVGFSALLSSGGDTDIRLADVLDQLAEDRRTHAIVIYLDRVDGVAGGEHSGRGGGERDGARDGARDRAQGGTRSDARAFLSALSAIARLKPVVLMRSTQDAAPYCDALTRTGQVMSSNAVYEAALGRAGVVRIRTFSNLFAATRILASRARTKGRRLAVISNGAAPAMLACERIETKGFRSPRLDSTRHAALSEALSDAASEHFTGTPFSGHNPIVLRDSDALAAQYRAAIDVLHDPTAFDAILVIFVPDSRNDPDVLARAVIEASPAEGEGVKGSPPLFACWMGDASVRSARERFAAAGIANFRTPEAATDAFDFLHRYHVSRQQLLQLPNPLSRHTRADIDSARTLIAEALAEGVRVLDPDRTRRLLALFDIRMLPSKLAGDVEEAVRIAEEVGWPVVMKLVSPNIAYKASVLPSRLGLENATSVRGAWHEISAALARRRPEAGFGGVLVERMHPSGNHRTLAVSLARDATFGPVLSVGLGDELTVLTHRAAVQLPPLNGFLIDAMLAERDIAAHLGAFRHTEAIDPTPIAQVLRRLSELACELPDVFSLDINPLRASADGAVAMDVQVVLERARTPRRYAHLAIHPYPWQWMRLITLKDGQRLQLRPIRPEDGESIRALVREMSAESRFFRFMHAINELSPQMVAQFTKLDYDRQMAFVAASDGTERTIAGVSRYAMDAERREGEFAVSVADAWQGLGLASALMRLLIEHATAQGLERLRGDVLRDNRAMHALMHSLGFQRHDDPDDPEVMTFTLPLPMEQESDGEGSTGMKGR